MIKISNFRFVVQQKIASLSIILNDFLALIFFPPLIFFYNLFSLYYLRVIFSVFFKRKIKYVTANKYSKKALDDYFANYIWVRKLKNIMFFWVISVFFLVAIAFTCAILGYFIILGIIHFRIQEIWTPFSSTQLSRTGSTGLAGPLVSTLLMLFISLIVSLPVALLVVIYLREYCRRNIIKIAVLRFSHICNAIPSIVFGIIGVLIFVTLIHFNRLGFSILSAAFTISLVLLPTMIVSFYQSFDRVPTDVRHGALSLGATRFQLIRTLVIPIAITGLIKCLVISLTRGAGEAAPILFTIGGSNAIPHSALDSGNTLTLLLFQQFLNPSNQTFFYSIAFLILLLILFLNIFLRVLFYPIGLRKEIKAADILMKLKPGHVKKIGIYKLKQLNYTASQFFFETFNFYRIWRR